MIRQTVHRVAVVAMLFLCTTQVFAHDEFRIIGTVTKLQDSQLQVKTKEGKTLSIKLNTETFIHRDKEKEKVRATELKAGHSVVVDALGDDATDLLALEVRIVPAIAPSTSK